MDLRKTHILTTFVFFLTREIGHLKISREDIFLCPKSSSKCGMKTMFRVSFSSDLLDKSWSRRRVNYVGDRRSYLHDYPENARDGRWRRRTYRDGGGWILIQRRRGTDQEGVSSRKFSGEEDRCGESANKPGNSPFLLRRSRQVKARKVLFFLLLLLLKLLLSF